MSGEKNLDILIGNMDPVLNDGEYVYCTLPGIQQFDSESILFSFREKESITIVVAKEFADKNQLEYFTVCAWITLNIHSSLEAVGLTAAFSNALMKAGISCNVVAAFYHDHIFVSIKDSNKAIEVLKKLSADNRMAID